MRTMGVLSFGVAVSAGCLALPTVAMAQSANADTANYDRTEVLAPHSAFEIGFEGGYTQPFGELADGMRVGDVAKSGGAAGLNIGYRFTPRWALSLYGQFHESSVEDNLPGDVDVRGVAAGMMGTFHMRPYRVVDPYLSIGTGYRAFFMAREGDVNETLHGFELGRAMFGVDFRVSEDVALGPQIGADVNVFVSDKVEGRDMRAVDSDAIRPSTFLFAGIGGRFDLGGRRIADDDDLSKTRDVPAVGPTPAAGPKPARRTSPTTGIRVDQSILTACGISAPRAYFEFDSADVQAADKSTLNLVAQCFTTGPLKGKSMQVIGHADPRGTDEYNEQLGESRAVSVEEFLVTRGVADDKVITGSHGEAEATDDPSEFAFDRRVEILLVK